MVSPILYSWIISVFITCSFSPSGKSSRYLFTGWNRSRNELGCAKFLGALDVTAESASCERNHRPASLRTEGSGKSLLLCIRRSDKHSTALDNHGCPFQLNIPRLPYATMRTPLSRVLRCYCSRGHYHNRGR